ncbi:MAG: 16S rRNA (guanine(966)-N(2))-methyltransferase RsmD [Blastocatellia bacterium]|nr:MAG: 16S rRNA (guanine(966)-N(2))-methyltransferase RsmD [Blastocatellia bacterium]
MRVIAGSLKGRRLRTPTWPGLRPTSDKLRETLFDILAPRVAGARVLDGYAGTGALGIEAISRGAAWVSFVEHDPRAAALIAENLAHCRIANGYVIIRADVARALKVLSERPGFEPFHIVLLDPPYIVEPVEHLLRTLNLAALVLAPTGIMVLEHARRHRSPATAGRLSRSREVHSGDSTLAFFE